MGVESGGTGGRVPRCRKISGRRPPRTSDISVSVFLTHGNFVFSTIIKIRWPKSDEKLNFGGRWVWVPINPSPPKQSFLATPLWKEIYLRSSFPRRNCVTITKDILRLTFARILCFATFAGAVRGGGIQFFRFSLLTKGPLVMWFFTIARR